MLTGIFYEQPILLERKEVQRILNAQLEESTREITCPEKNQTNR
jgi:hypothetical protein